MRAHALLILWLTAVAMAQSPAPRRVTIEELNLHPQQYDGQLVEVNALYGIGWEGDDFLAAPETSNTDFYTVAHVWFSCSRKQHSACYGLRSGIGTGTFVGYFHFNPVYPHNLVYDRGPLQLEVTDFRLPEKTLGLNPFKR